MKPPQEQTQGLADTSRESFELELVRFTNTIRRESTASRRQLLAEAVKAISSNELLPSREADRRLRLILAIRGFDSHDILAIAHRFRDGTPSLQNTLLSALPPDQKRLFLLGSRPAITTEQPEKNREAERPSPEQLTESPENSVFRAVALLGSAAEHARNVSFLEENDFTPLRREGAGALEELLSSDVCGLIVAGSFWEGKSAREQKNDLNMICNLSSLLFLKIDDTNLAASAGKLLVDIQSRDRRGPEFCRGRCELTPTDMAALNRVVALLEASEPISITSDELSEPESRLLRLATTSLVRGRYIDRGSAIGRMGLRFIPGGRSGARVAIATPDDGGVPLIAKMHSISSLQEELDRYEKYIRRWESAIHPSLYFHLGASLIIYNLVDDLRTPRSPAPTLGERLGYLSMSELGTWGKNLASESHLSSIIQRVVLKLEELNKLKANTEDHDKLTWLPSGVQYMMENGTQWSLRADNQEIDLKAYFLTWIERAKRLEGKATVHGDLHLRNILAVDDQRPVFIDYSLSGPGHPCYDLVRFSTAVSCRFFRMLQSEEEISCFLREVLIDGKSYDEVLKSHSPLLSSATNRVATQALVWSRAACLRVLKTYRGEFYDFLALHGLVAGYALTDPDHQCGMARAILRAII